MRIIKTSIFNGEHYVHIDDHNRAMDEKCGLSREARRMALMKVALGTVHCPEHWSERSRAEYLVHVVDAIIDRMEATRK